MTIIRIWNTAKDGQVPKVGEKLQTGIGLASITKVEHIKGSIFHVTTEDGGIPEGALD